MTWYKMQRQKPAFADNPPWPLTYGGLCEKEFPHYCAQWWNSATNTYTKCMCNRKEGLNMRYQVYPVYYREGYGYQTDNPKGTDGVPSYWVLVDEKTEEVITEVEDFNAAVTLKQFIHYMEDEE